MSRRAALDLLPSQAARPWIAAALVAIAFLAALSLAGAAASARAADGWRQALAGDATVQVRPRVGETGSEAGARAAQALGAVEGVEEVAVLPREAAERLVAAWVGETVAEDLPLPWLVTVRLDRRAPASAVSLSRALAAAGVDADVDDHQLWRAEADRAASGAVIAVALLASLATGALLAFVVGWTLAGVAAGGDLIRTFSLLGAPDGRIMGLFQRRHVGTALTWSAAGAGAAGVVLTALRLLGGAEGLVTALPFRWADLALLIPVPVLAAGAALVAARVAVLARLKGVD